MNQLVTGREPWPSIPLLTEEAEQRDPEAAKEYYELRRQAIILATSDPLRYGYEPAIWAKADSIIADLKKEFPRGVIHLLVSGGNRAAKSEWAAKRVVQSLVNKPGSRWWCADATETASRANQQRLIWKYLPPEWKNERTGRTSRTKTTKINYSIAGGFTENIFVLPNGSECEFKFYEQKIGSLQAVELDGFWGDELLPLDWIETLEYRLVNRNGVFELTFTPVEGYTQTVAYYLDEAKTLEETDAPLITKKDESGKVIGIEKVPRVLQCKRPNARVIYFHTQDNPFGNYEGMKEQVKLKSKEEKLMRVYGVVIKAAHVQFPMFKESIHVISLNRWKEILHDKPNGTRYHLVDPCSGRNWFMIWVYCPEPDKWIIYREWPSHGHEAAYIPGIGDPGEWAISGEAHDGERGPAQNPFGLGLQRYKDEIIRVENGEEIFERWMDSRYGNSAKDEREGTTTLIQQMRDLDMDFIAAATEKKILNVSDGSIDIISTALYYDDSVGIGEFSPILSRLNEPKLLITENCPNVIWALKNWTGKDGAVGACKDPIDCIRYAMLSELNYIGADYLLPRSDWKEAVRR